VPPPPQLLSNFLQPVTQPISARFPFKLELALSGAITDVSESEKVECFRLAKPTLCSSLGRKASEFDQASLFRM
jgi:hypothetical protein